MDTAPAVSAVGSRAPSPPRGRERTDRWWRTARSIRWEAPAIAAGAVLVLVVWQRNSLSDAPVALAVVRAAGVVLVAGSLALLDDPGFSQIGAVPTRLPNRELPRLAIMTGLVLGPVVVTAWATDLPWRGVVIEIAATLAFGAATALVLRIRFGHLEPSIPVSILVVVFSVVLVNAPPRYPFWVAPGPDWVDAHRRWAVLLGASLVVLVYSLRDPAARPVSRLLRSGRSRQGVRHR